MYDSHNVISVVGLAGLWNIGKEFIRRGQEKLPLYSYEKVTVYLGKFSYILKDS